MGNRLAVRSIKYHNGEKKAENIHTSGTDLNIWTFHLKKDPYISLPLQNVVYLLICICLRVSVYSFSFPLLSPMLDDGEDMTYFVFVSVICFVVLLFLAVGHIVVCAFVHLLGNLVQLLCKC